MATLFLKPRKTTLRHLGATAAVFTLAVGLAACSTPAPAANPSSDGGSGSLDGNGQTIVAFMPTTAIAYVKDVSDTLKSEGEKHNFTVKVFENKLDQTEEDQQVQQYLATGEQPAAFIWWPSNAEAGINSSRLLSKTAPVIQISQSVAKEGSEYITAYAGAGANIIGESAGAMLLEARKERLADGGELHSKDGNLIEFTFPTGYQQGIDRHDGMIEGTKSAPFNVLQVEPVKSIDAQGGFDAASLVIPKFLGEGIDFVFAQNLSMAGGVVTALEQNGLVPGKDVIVVSGNDAGDKTPLMDGRVYSAVIQSPVVEAKLALRTIMQYLATGKIDDGEIRLPVETDEPELTATPPAKVTYMPSPPFKVADIDGFKLWGLSYPELGR